MFSVDQHSLLRAMNDILYIYEFSEEPTDFTMAGIEILVGWVVVCGLILFYQRKIYSISLRKKKKNSEY